MLSCPVPFERALSPMKVNRKKTEPQTIAIQQNHSENTPLVLQIKPGLIITKRSSSQISRKSLQPENQISNFSFVRPTSSLAGPLAMQSFEKLFNLRKVKPDIKEKLSMVTLKTDTTAEPDRSVDFHALEKLDSSFQTLDTEKYDVLSVDKESRLRDVTTNIMRKSNMSFKCTEPGLKAFKINEVGQIRKKIIKDVSLKENETSAMELSERISNTQIQRQTLKLSEDLLKQSIQTKREILDKLNAVSIGKNLPGYHWADQESFITAKSKAGRLKAEIEAKNKKRERVEQVGTEEDLKKTLRIIKDKFLKRVIKKGNNKEMRKKSVDPNIERKDRKDESKNISSNILEPLYRNHKLNQSYDLLDQLDSSENEQKRDSTQLTEKRIKGYMKKENSSMIQKMFEERERKSILGYQSSPLVPKFVSFSRPKKILKTSETNVTGRSFFKVNVTTPERSRSQNESSQEIEKVEVKRSSNQSLALKDIGEKAYKIRRYDSVAVGVDKK